MEKLDKLLTATDDLLFIGKTFPSPVTTMMCCAIDVFGLLRETREMGQRNQEDAKL